MNLRRMIADQLKPDPSVYNEKNYVSYLQFYNCNGDLLQEIEVIDASYVFNQPTNTVHALGMTFNVPARSQAKLTVSVHSQYLNGVSLSTLNDFPSMLILNSPHGSYAMTGLYATNMDTDYNEDILTIIFNVAKIERK